MTPNERFFVQITSSKWCVEIFSKKMGLGDFRVLKIVLHNQIINKIIKKFISEGFITCFNLRIIHVRNVY